MAAELGLLSLSQLQKLAQQQHAAHLPVNDDDDSWEVRAFARDTSNAMGTTWPPRSYTCTFCRREFRSAQALGGHMNVHRRDRARLRHSPQVSDPSSSSVAVAVPSPPMIFPSSEFVGSGGVFFCPVQTPAGSVFAPATEGVNLPASSSNRGASLLAKVGMARVESEGEERSDYGVAVEELDLELRLGW